MTDSFHDYTTCGGPGRCGYCGGLATKMQTRALSCTSLRTTAAAPPDPYEKGLADLRRSDAQAAAARTYQPTPRSTTPVLDAGGVPDPYAAALEQMRKEGR